MNIAAMKIYLNNILPQLKKLEQLDIDTLQYDNKNSLLVESIHELEKEVDGLYWISDKKAYFPTSYAHILYKKNKITFRYMSGQGTVFDIFIDHKNWKEKDAYNIDKDEQPLNCSIIQANKDKLVTTDLEGNLIVDTGAYKLLVKFLGDKESDMELLDRVKALLLL